MKTLPQYLSIWLTADKVGAQGQKKRRVKKTTKTYYAVEKKKVEK